MGFVSAEVTEGMNLFLSNLVSETEGGGQGVVHLTPQGVGAASKLSREGRGELGLAVVHF